MADSGNVYIGEGTWLEDRRENQRKSGVVAGFPGTHDSGTVKIWWNRGRSRSTEFVSVPMFLERLRDGQLQVTA